MFTVAMEPSGNTVPPWEVPVWMLILLKPGLPGAFVEELLLQLARLQ